MTLSEEARERLADVVALQPTKNAELQDRWDMDSGSEVHQFLENELKEYYYRNEDSLICATEDAAELLGMETDDRVVRVPELQAAVLDVVAGPDERSQSVVSVLQSLRAAGHDPDVDDVRSALRNLENKGLLERIQRTVPTYRLTSEREEFEVEVLD